MSEQGYIEMMKANGWRVYSRGRDYCYVTDGTHIAYVQWSNLGNRVTTVHKPNRVTGTGFVISDLITIETITEAMLVNAPAWATTAERKSIRKYANWEQFHNLDSFNRQLSEV